MLSLRRGGCIWANPVNQLFDLVDLRVSLLGSLGGCGLPTPELMALFGLFIDGAIPLNAGSRAGPASMA